MADTITTASTFRMKLIATKDAAAWDISGGTVTLKLKDPSGVTTTKTASLLTPTGGIAYYDLLTTDVTTAGRWTRSWRVVVGAFDLTSLPETFTALESP